jgi:alpha-tubulin suppressor-like RCC1 family protein
MNEQRSFSSLGYASLFVTVDGVPLFWGTTSNRLAAGSSDAIAIPKPLVFPGEEKLQLTWVAPGEYHMVCQTQDGRLFAWGDRENGQVPFFSDNIGVPALLKLPDSDRIEKIFCGGRTGTAITEDGSVIAWGHNMNNHLCHPLNSPITTPTKMQKFPSPVVCTALGYSHLLVLTQDGSLYSSGGNSSGELGLGDSPSIATPTLVPLKDVVKISAGSFSSMAITKDHSLYVWGWNQYGSLGVGDNANRTTPTLLLHDVQEIASGWGHSLALCLDGSLYTWGYNGSGQLGLGTASDISNVPQRLVLPSNQPIVSIGCGHDHSFALLQDGSLYLWGRNNEGQLGLPDLTAKNRELGLLAGYKFKLPIPDSAHLWRQVFFWIFLGRSDTSSVFSLLHTEILYNAVTFFFSGK